jgi:anti-anti-sigma regulatory factor
MLTAKLQLEGDQLRAELQGSLNEYSDLSQIIGSVPTTLEVNCKSLQRINSIGLRAWIEYFGKLREKGVRLRFRECSPAVIGCQNFVMNFMALTEIESLSVPFFCDKCQEEFCETVNVSEIARQNLHLEPKPCPTCHTPAELDEDETVYFAFLKNG